MTDGRIKRIEDRGSAVALRAMPRQAEDPSSLSELRRGRQRTDDR